jgi:cobalt-zinc-cadmium efflux system membrane fusion protein
MASFSMLSGKADSSTHTVSRFTICIAKIDVAVRVKAIAVQEFNGKPSVFIKSGNVFEVRPVKLGAKNSEWVEVLEGRSPNSEYVTLNSYVIKADILKSGASHSH